MNRMPERVTIRLTPEERETLLQAVTLSMESWKGTSHFARLALLNWARATLAAAKRPQTARRRRTA